MSEIYPLFEVWLEIPLLAAGIDEGKVEWPLQDQTHSQRLPMLRSMYPSSL